MASVLVIDDYQGTLDAFSTILRGAGFETAIAATGRGGIELALQQSFDVILVDLRLPDMSGIDVVHELKLSHLTARMVIVTVFPALDSSFDAASAGADGYVDGLLLGDDVVEVVSQALNGPLPVRHPPRRLAPADESPTRPASTLVDPRIRDVIRILAAELDKSLSVSELAARVELSESALRHLFHECVGVPLTRFRTEFRLQTAAVRLTTTHEDIRHIAYGVGFRSMSLRDFRRAFHERFGMSPKAYRARHWRGPFSPV